MSIKDYIKNIAPTPPAYRAIREDARRKGASGLSMRTIDREIAAVRRQGKPGTVSSPENDPGCR